MTRHGDQRPTFEVTGAYASTRGDECAALFNAYGIDFYPSQLHELDLFLARTEDGSLAAKTIGISKPRQNGKSFAARHYAIWMAVVEHRRVLFTAHHGGTTAEMFKLMRNFIEGTPDFAQQLSSDGVRKAGGKESINFLGGGCIEFNTRTNSVARGKTYDVIVVDEAQELTDEQADALTPTTIASDSGDPQTIYLGTPPNAKCPGTVFRQLHDRAHAGTAGGAWWLEWAATEVGDPHDEERWYRCCPAMGYRIRPENMADAADRSSPDGFAREYLGWWPLADAVEHVIAADAWDACRTDSPPTDGVTCFAAKFSPDGSEVAVSACVRPKAGVPHVECVMVRSTRGGVSWLADWLDERRGMTATVAIDGRSGAAALTEALAARRYPRKAVVVPRSAEMAKAVTLLVNAVREGAVTHIGQPALDSSATLTRRRRIGADGFGFETTDEGDATLIEACALAYWQAMTTRRDPSRRLKIT